MASEIARALGIRSRVLAHEMTAAHQERIKIEKSLRVADRRLSQSSLHFSEIKTALLCLGGAGATGTTAVELLNRAKCFSEKLTEVKESITEHIAQIQILGGELRQCQEYMAQTESHRRNLESSLKSIATESALALESRDCDEVIEIAAHKVERDDGINKSDADEEVTKVPHQQHLSRAGLEEQGQNSFAVLPLNFQQERSGNGNFESRNPSQSQSYSEQIVDPEGRSFREAVPAGLERQVESLRSWDRLGGQGVELELNFGSGRQMGIEVSSNSSGKVSVRFQSASTLDRYALWQQRADIAKALADAGCELGDVVVRGGKQCKT